MWRKCASFHQNSDQIHRLTDTLRVQCFIRRFNSAANKQITWKCFGDSMCARRPFCIAIRKPFCKFIRFRSSRFDFSWISHSKITLKLFSHLKCDTVLTSTNTGVIIRRTDWTVKCGSQINSGNRFARLPKSTTK